MTTGQSEVLLQVQTWFHGHTMRCRPMGAFASSHVILKTAQDAQTTSIFNRKVNNGRFLSCCYSLTLSYEYVSRFKLTMGVVDDFFIFQPISCTMLRVILFVSYAARASSDDDIFEDCHSGPWRLETLYRATWSREEESSTWESVTNPFPKADYRRILFTYLGRFFK